MSDSSDYTRAAVKYNPHTHGTGVRVVEISTGRRGTVQAIKETAPEWIEPFILWDGEAELSRANWMLLLEEML